MEKKKSSLAVRMSISLVCGLVAGLLLMFLRENLNSTGKEAVWATINSILFQDITAAGAEKALGIFYIIGQLFIRSLQLVIVPMVFTSITLAIGQISDTRTLGRISVKTIAGFLICSFFALLMACVVGIMIYNAGVFNIQVEGLEGSAGSTGSNPLNVILNIVPSNITAVFSTNTSVLAIVFLAVSLGLCMKAVGDEKSATLKKLITEVNDIVVVFLNYVVTKFGPFAIFVLLARTFATYGINHLKPALAYVIVTVILLLVFLFVGYPIFVAVTTKQNPVKFAKKIFRVAVFGFSTSSSAAALPLNVKTTTEELGVDEDRFLRTSARYDHQHERYRDHAGRCDSVHRRLRRIRCNPVPAHRDRSLSPDRIRRYTGSSGRRRDHPVHNPFWSRLHQRRCTLSIQPDPCDQPPDRDVSNGA